MTTSFSFVGSRLWLTAALLIVLFHQPLQAADSANDATGFLKEFQNLQKQINQQYSERFTTVKGKIFDPATSPDEQIQMMRSFRDEMASLNAPLLQQVLDVVKPHASEDAALDPLLWIANQDQKNILTDELAPLVIEHHLLKPKTIQTAFRWRAGPVCAERVLRAQLASSELPEDERPKQMLALAQLLQASFDWRQGDAKRRDEAIQIFKQLIEKYDSVEYMMGETFAGLAKTYLFEIENLSLGKIAPDIVGEDMDGVPFKLSDYRGKVVLLSFWATWCGPCMAKVPQERLLVKQYEGRPFVLIGVNADLDKAAAIATIKKEEISWRSFTCGEKGPYGPIARDWNIIEWPTMYIIDQAGVIRSKRLSDGLIETLVNEVETDGKKVGAVESSGSKR